MLLRFTTGQPATPPGPPSGPGGNPGGGATGRPRRSAWIPWVFVGAMGLVIAVNGALVYSALSTFTGTTVGHAYDQGRAYNDVLAEQRRQDALGWTARLRAEGGALRLAANDAAGPLAAGAGGRLVRPLTGESVALEFVPEGAGAWRAALPALAPGQWEARLVLRRGADHLDLRQRVFLP
ncbi:FixH family protein [Roseomonas sp. NAR14]|uniref:FixH family protein n=1 Tax=Roseomonas acroporae TaxID=2937791 RepID=A0A9X2BW85_9PROT|nr:FixH family protein [Roseomonas acroporae]MCK8784769.1 FixH family protein [Roseomonas acroporae]